MEKNCAKIINVYFGIKYSTLVYQCHTILTSSSSSSSQECAVFVPVGKDIGTDVEYTWGFLTAARLRIIGASASL